MHSKTAKANVKPVRQRTQYSCMASSMSMCLNALGYDTNEDLVNKVMGAQPMKGAAWEQALACAQHFGCRATLTMPCTVEQLKQWTDSGVPVMIAWNPEGRDWSHASVVFDVDDDLNVYVADPNIPNPKETVRVVPEDEFYHKWFEKFPNYLVRRPACAIEREVTVDGRQVRASVKESASSMKIKVPAPTVRNDINQGLIDRHNSGGGSHHNRDKDFITGKSRREKHKKDWRDKEALENTYWKDSSYSGNPDGKALYPNEIDHGYEKAIAGGTDVMQKLVKELEYEQGTGLSLRVAAKYVRSNS